MSPPGGGAFELVLDEQVDLPGRWVQGTPSRPEEMR